MDSLLNLYPLAQNYGARLCMSLIGAGALTATMLCVRMFLLEMRGEWR